jgi:hypothetical protein
VKLLVTVIVNGKRHSGKYIFGSPLPKLFGHGAVTLGAMHMRGFPRSSPVQNGHVVTLNLALHELSHKIERWRRGFVEYWRTALWESLTIRRWHDRPFEQRAMQMAADLEAGRVLGVVIDIEALRRTFT